MRSTLTPASAALVLLAGLAVACATPPPAAGERAVACPKCQMIWVERLDPDDPYGMTYSSVQTMECPDCRSAVATFFATGEWKHTCATCGDVLIHCTEHD